MVGGIIKRVGTVAVFLVVNAALLFVSAGRVDWLWAWVFLGICLLSMAINGTILLRTSPETIAERGRPQATKGWDKLVGGLWALCLFLVVPVVAGLDERFAWTGQIGPAWNIAGALVLAVGLGLAGWAMIANAFFSTAVRIQTDRGHTVCRSGPYRFVRHPGYVGFVMQSVGTPVLLGSPFALVPGVAAAALMVIRTLLEDPMLQRELDGYQDFVREVRYRLLPGVW
ncbi:MAG: isoprenylcysteine carboxylmethyltransferase family protein [Gemmatimonadales bacterium]|nr:isoprenylcysteine carboxylmethyltransferase family protein [Gemmatimonadales bacterium]NIN12578.1 isoprenylcysteine carboxylmethyltransferase family protein [Gemmatimonadales bacterium]NIR03573.1 isoprenylcysteine carboxylmethyltransferase family protein [Gemmatimonadales bacterium]NIS65895.1 isoprenylcysteine carboxylmethyltransferase family protein [Gemmatimonadales bacterium]